MCKLKSRRIQSPDDAQRLPNDNILGILPSNLRLETVGNKVIRESFDRLWQITLENDFKGKFVIITTQDLCLPFPGISERPRLLVEDLFSVMLSSTSRRSRGVMIVPTITERI